MGEIKRLSWLCMYASKLFGTDFFPVNFKIEISSDSISWEELYIEKGYSLPLEPAHSDLWDFNSVECRYIRLSITKAKTLFLFFKVVQIAEIEVYGCDLLEEIPVMGEQGSLPESEKAQETLQSEGSAPPDDTRRLPSIPGKPVVDFE